MSLYCFGKFQFDPGPRLLFHEGELVPLTPKASDLLNVLLENSHQVLSKEQISAAVWHDVYIEESNITKNISILRKTLWVEEDGENPIRTIPKRGYQFALSLTIREATSPATKSQPVTPALFVPAGITPRILAISALMLALMIVCTVAVVARRHGIAHSRPALAVLPFANLSANPDVSWVSTALRETLVSDLDADGTFRVIPDDAVTQMQRDLNLQPSTGFSRANLDSIRANLGCDDVISGAYLKVADSIRVDAYVQDTRTGKILSRISYSRPANELLDVITQTGDRLRSALGGPPLPAEQQQQAAARIPATPDALQLYSQGLQSLREMDAPSALSFFSRLAAVDPDFPMVHSALSETYELMGEDEKAMAEAKTAADHSSRLPREERMVIQANDERMSRHWPQATAMQQALWQAFPDKNQYGIRLAQVQVLAGKTQDAIATVDRLEQGLGRNEPAVYMAEASIRYQTGEFSAMRTAALEAERLANLQEAHTLYGRARTQEGDALVHVGTSAEARAAFADARTIAEKYGDKVGLMHALRRGAGALGTSDPRASIPIFDQDCIIAKAVGDAREFANCRIAIGFAHQRLGEIANARKEFADALDLSRNLGDQRLVLVCLEVLGAIEGQMANWQEATRDLDSADALATKMKSSSMHYMVLGDRGMQLAARGNLTAGRALVEQAVSQARNEKDPLGIARELDKLSQILAWQQSTAETKAILEEECALWDKTGQAILVAKCRIALAELAFDTGDLTGAASQLKQTLYDANSIVPGLAVARLKFGLALAANNPPDARSAAAAAASLANDAGDDFATRFENAIIQARLAAAVGDASHARAELNRVARQAGTLGLANEQTSAQNQLRDIDRSPTRRQSTTKTPVEGSGTGVSH